MQTGKTIITSTIMSVLHSGDILPPHNNFIHFTTATVFHLRRQIWCLWMCAAWIRSRTSNRKALLQINGMNYRGHENLILLNPTHRINQSVRVMCGTSAQFSGAAGREQSAHTPPAPTGRRWAWMQSRKEKQDDGLKEENWAGDS